MASQNVEWVRWPLENSTWLPITHKTIQSSHCSSFHLVRHFVCCLFVCLFVGWLVVCLFVCSFVCLLSEFIVLVHSHLNVRVCASGVGVEATCQVHRVVHEPTLVTVVVVCWLFAVCLFSS